MFFSSLLVEITRLENLRRIWYIDCMRKVALVLALLFCADIAFDTFDNCVESKTDQPCHACLCQTHAVAPSLKTAARIAAARPTFVIPMIESFADRLADKTLFRPPKTLA